MRSHTNTMISAQAANSRNSASNVLSTPSETERSRSFASSQTVRPQDRKTVRGFALAFCLLLSAFCLLPFTASAQLNWSGTQTFNSNTTISQNINLTGNVTIVVNTDKDVIISGVISG
ncbi:MAG: hypothetical protein FWF09_04505, partial [Bacteroidales bacterium]|nr:hypothetical protein [Bacteroidales bacterium]